MPLTYRRGFQRLYLLFAVGWLALVLYKTPPDHLKVWEQSVNYEAPAKHSEAVSAPETLPADFFDTLPDRPTRVSKTVSLLGILFLPPILGYVFFFNIAPWVFRGFKGAT